MQLASCTRSHSKIHEHCFLVFFISRIFTNHVFLFPGETCVCVCVRAPKLWVPHSHSYASASYQGLLCLIELRSCFPFISQMQWRVILLLPNKTYKTGYTILLSKLLLTKKSEAHWAITKQDNEIWRVCRAVRKVKFITQPHLEQLAATVDSGGSLRKFWDLL